MTEAHQPTERPVRAAQFAGRASNVLLLLALLAGVAFLLVVGPATQQLPLPELVLGLGSVVVVIACTWGLAAALDRARPWAPQTALIVLWLIALSGLLLTVVQLLTRSSIRIPLDTLIAGWALAAWDRPALQPGRLGRQGVAIVALLVAAQVLALLPLLGTPAGSAAP
jgi:hypothetical protein